MPNRHSLLNSSSLKEFNREVSRAMETVSGIFLQSGSAFCGALPQEVRKHAFKNGIFPQKGLGYDRTLRILDKDVLPYMLKPSLHGYMAHLHSPVLLESIVSELLISVFNQSMDSWDQAPIATEIEIAVVRMLCEIYGYNPERADGIFTSGGTQSNFQAVLAARDKAFCKLGFDIKKSGLRSAGKSMRIYTSSISHFSIVKSAHILGLGYDSVREVPVDSRMKMDIDALERMVCEDVDAGLVPMMAVATIGTTDFGSVDDVAEISRICRKYDMHLHCDAAYGSGARISPTYAGRIGPVELADSITIDFHKMFLLPISCSCILFKSASDLDCLSFHADYLNRREDEEEGYDNLVSKSLQTTRRFDALKVYVSFVCRGRDGYAAIIDKLFENARYFYSILDCEDCIEVLNEPELTSVVFRIIPEKGDADQFNKQVRRRLIHEFGIVIGQTVANGHVYLKFTLLNPTMERADYDAIKQLLLL